MKTKEEYMAEWQKEHDLIGEVLAANREIGIPIADRLQEAHNVWLETGDKEKGLEALRQAWLVSQDALEVFQRAHAGALKYFVDLKNSIKKTMEKGELPPGYPRPVKRFSPTDPDEE